VGGSELLRHLHQEIDELADVRERLERAIADEPPALATDPGIIRSGYHAELDDLRNLSQHSKQIIAAMEERERKRTNIASLKIRFNQIFGYYIEISKPNLHLAPADYERKQTLVNAERFTSPELKEYERKILAADERDRKSTRLNSSHGSISYAVFCLKKQNTRQNPSPRARNTSTNR